jgi:hypothetical protein
MEGMITTEEGLRADGYVFLECRECLLRGNKCEGTEADSGCYTRPEFRKNILVCRIESGSVYYESYTGDWLGEALPYLLSVFSEEVEPGLEIELVELGYSWPLSEAEVYLVTIHDPSWVHDAGYWDLDYGYVLPESHLEWNGPVSIERMEDEC